MMNRMSLLRRLQSFIPVRGIDEYELFAEAKKILPKTKFEEIDNVFLKRITEEYGIEKATAFYYQKLLYQSKSSQFINKMKAKSIQLSKLHKIHKEVWIIPAGFYRDIPEFDGDGELIRKIGAHYGTQTKLIGTDPKGTIKNNALEIIAALEHTNAKNLIIFSISKGSADLRYALEQRPDLQRKIFAWVTIGGLLKNNPLADVLLEKNNFTKMLQKTVLQILGIPFDFITEFSTKSGLLNSPVNVTIKHQFTILPVPLPSHMLGNILNKYKILSQFGPNDGYTLLNDSILPGSLILPAWGADHYFRTPLLSENLYKVFSHLAEQKE